MTYIVPSPGFEDVLPKLDPPLLPGMWLASSNPIGVKSPSFLAFVMRCRNCSRSSSDSRYGFRSSTVNFCRAKGGGLVGNGCVGQTCSPGTSVLVGTGRSSIGQTGS